jgi:hypothetical protein
MFTKSKSRKVSFPIVALLLFALSSAVRAQTAEDCEAALAVAGGGVSLTDTATTTTTKKVDEWDGDILKLQVFQPGILVVSGEGPAVAGSLYTADPSSSSPLLEDGGQLGTAYRPLTMVVQPGEHCVQVTPPPGATGNLRLRATFFDVCSLGPQDDHGDSFLCATEISPGETLTGEVSEADQDVFSFELTAAKSVTLTLTGPEDLAASLHGEDGTLLAADGRGVRTLGAGRYFVRIEGGTGEGGSYEIGVSVSP